MTYNFKLLFRLVSKSLLAGPDSNARLTPKRIGVILLLFPAYVLIEAAAWLGFLLDDLLFRSWRHVEVKEPLFILGLPRSGTTFLQRLLAKDQEKFTSMKFWEIAFAPSITQKKFWLALGKLDSLLGRPVKKLILSVENRMLAKLGRIHASGLFEAEEDEFILLHIFSTSFLTAVFPFEDDLRPLMRFDDDLDPDCRARIMAFYKRCVQAHLFVFGRGRRYLSKNPSFSSKVVSLCETFSDANIVCMVRTPLEVLPSTISLLTSYYNLFMSPVEKYPQREFIYATMAHWYRHAVDSLKDRPAEQKLILTYGTLTENSDRAVRDLYERFGLCMTTTFDQILREESAKAQAYKSRHAYSLEQVGLKREDVIADFQDVFERFGFDRNRDA